MSIEPSRYLLDKAESWRYHLPSLLAPDKIGLMFIMSALLSVVILVNVPNSSFEHFRFTLLFSFFALMVFAVSIGLTRRWLNRQAIWLATLIIFLLAFAIVFGLHHVTEAFVPSEISENVDLGRRLVFSGVLVIGFCVTTTSKEVCIGVRNPSCTRAFKRCSRASGHTFYSTA